MHSSQGIWSQHHVHTVDRHSLSEGCKTSCREGKESREEEEGQEGK